MGHLFFEILVNQSVFFSVSCAWSKTTRHHHTLLLVIDTRSRPTRNSWGLKLKKKIVIPCFRGHPGILVPGLWGEKQHFLERRSSHGTQSEKVNPKQVFVFYILYSWNDDIEYYIIYIYIQFLHTVDSPKMIMFHQKTKSDPDQIHPKPPGDATELCWRGPVVKECRFFFDDVGNCCWKTGRNSAFTSWVW